MNILRKLILFGWMAIACTAFGNENPGRKTSGQNPGKYGNKVIGTDGNDEAAHNNLGCHIH